MILTIAATSAVCLALAVVALRLTIRGMREELDDETTRGDSYYKAWTDSLDVVAAKDRELRELRAENRELRAGLPAPNYVRWVDDQPRLGDGYDMPRAL